MSQKHSEISGPKSHFLKEKHFFHLIPTLWLDVLKIREESNAHFFFKQIIV